jgi:hypothetical protein
MNYYSNDPNVDRINRMIGEINQIMCPFFHLFHTGDYPILKNLYILNTNIKCML